MLTLNIPVELVNPLIFSFLLICSFNVVTLEVFDESIVDNENTVPSIDFHKTKHIPPLDFRNLSSVSENSIDESATTDGPEQYGKTQHFLRQNKTTALVAGKKPNLEKDGDQILLKLHDKIENQGFESTVDYISTSYSTSLSPELANDMVLLNMGQKTNISLYENEDRSVNDQNKLLNGIERSRKVLHSSNVAFQNIEAFLSTVPQGIYDKCYI